MENYAHKKQYVEIYKHDQLINEDSDSPCVCHYSPKIHMVGSTYQIWSRSSKGIGNNKTQKSRAESGWDLFWMETNMLCLLKAVDER